MNDPEVTMLEAPPNQLIALTTALEAAGDLFDQVRAMTWRLLHPRG